MLLAFAPLWFTKVASYWLEDKVSKFGHAKQSIVGCSEHKKTELHSLCMQL